MKLSIKRQPFLSETTAAVCDVFNGQPRRSSPAWLTIPGIVAKGKAAY